jgi:streptogramin lyase
MRGCVILCLLTLLGVNLCAGVASAEPTITEFSTGITAGSEPAEIVAGFEGNLWFTEYSGHRIGRITPTGEVTEFSTGLTTQGFLVPGIAAGADGNLWFTEGSGSQIGRITPSGEVTEFSNGIGLGDEPEGIVAGLEGNLWFTIPSTNRIGRITTSGEVTEFSNGIGPDPRGIAAGPDGNLWFTEPTTNRIGRITPNGEVTQFSSGITAGSYPSAITAGPDGNLWFTEPVANQIGRITPNGEVTEFSSGIPAGSDPTGITTGPDGNLWFTELNGIGRITPSGEVTELSNGLTAGSEPDGITAGPEGNVWFTEFGGDRIGRVNLQATPPPVPAAISLTPSSAQAPIQPPRPAGGVALTAHVTDSSGRPVAQTSVAFRVVSGPDAEAGFKPPAQTTTSTGDATIVLPGDTAGTDVVEAEAGSVTSPRASIAFVAQPGDLTAQAKTTVTAKVGKVVPMTERLATFKDPDGRGLPAGNFTARVEWGDPYFYSTEATVVATKTGFAVTPKLPHMFCYAGTHTFTVTIVEAGDLESAVTSGTVDVKAAAKGADGCDIGGLAGCTGTVVSSPGTAPVVMLATHCLLGIGYPPGPGGYAFIPGGRAQSGASAPFGHWNGDVAYANGNFASSGYERNYDFGFIGLNLACTESDVLGQCPKEPSAAVLGGGLTVRWFPAQSNRPPKPPSTPWTIDAPFTTPASCTTKNGVQLFTQLTSAGYDWNVEPCTIADNTYPGSGAPWLDSKNEVVSVQSGILGSDDVGPYLGPEAEQAFRSFTAMLSGYTVP